MKYHTFLPRFHDLIRQGSKQTTIRGRTLVKPGEVFALRYWTGKAYRSPMGILGTATCQTVMDICVSYSDTGRPVTVQGVLLTPTVADILAVRDGFENAASLMRHFEDAGKLYVPMRLITWGDTFKAAP